MLKRQAEALLHALQQLHPKLIIGTTEDDRSPGYWILIIEGGSVDY